MNVEYVSSIDEIIMTGEIDRQICTEPLFHGSTEKGISASEEEIKTMYDVSLKLRDVLTRHFTGIQHTKEVQDYLSEPENEWVVAAIGTVGVSYYEYGDIYLTTSLAHAMSHATCSFGEIGIMVSSLIKAREDLGQLKGDEVLDSEIALFNRLHQEYICSRPVIVVYERVRFSDLLYAQDGSPFLCGDENIDLEKLDLLYNSGARYDFRLLQPQKYVGKAAGIELFQDYRKRCSRRMMNEH